MSKAKRRDRKVHANKYQKFSKAEQELKRWEAEQERQRKVLEQPEPIGPGYNPAGYQIENRGYGFYADRGYRTGIRSIG